MLDPNNKEPAAPSPMKPSPLYKQHSWSPDSDRDEAWLRRKGLHKSRRRAGGQLHRLSRSVTDDDLEELRGCIDLGFGFGHGSPASTSTTSITDEGEAGARLSDTFPALDLYYAIHRNYSDTVLAAGPRSEPSPAGSPLSIYSPGDSPQQVKTRLRQWAQVVACSVRQQSL